MDDNAKAQAGVFNADPSTGTRPMNRNARDVDNKTIRTLSVRDLLTTEAQRARKKPDHSQFCTTGHYRLDELTGGFSAGCVWVVGAQTSWGKSSFAVSVADENLRRGKRVLIVSAEDPSTTYGRRLLTRRAGVSADRLRKRCLEAEELTRVADVERRAEDVPVYVDAIGKTVEVLGARLTSIIRGEGIDMVVFDYLQAFRSESRQKDRRNEINHITRLLTDVIKTDGKTGMILSQLTVDKTLKGPPGSYAIRESQDVSNGAEVIALGYTPTDDIVRNPGKDARGQQLQPEVLFRAGQRYLCLEKNKEGPAKEKIEMRWNAISASFESVRHPSIEASDRIHRDAGVDDEFFDVLQ